MNRKITHAEYQKLQREAALSRERNGEIKRLNKIVKELKIESTKTEARLNNWASRALNAERLLGKASHVITEPLRWPRSKIKELKQIING